MTDHAPNPDECAIGADGQLLPAEKIVFRNDPDDEEPLPPVTEKEIMTKNRQSGGTSLAETRTRRGDAGKNMSTFLDHEKLDETNEPTPKFRKTDPNRKKRASRPRKPKNSKAPKAEGAVDASTDSEDGDYSEGTSSEDASDGEGMSVNNDEIADILASKTDPNPSKRTKRKHAAIFEKPAPPPVVPSPTLQPSASSSSIASTMNSTPTGPKSTRRSPIYLFFEEVDKDSDGKKVEGTRYYRCYHGQRRTFTITKGMKGNTKHMVEHLRAGFATMHKLFLEMNERKGPATTAEVVVASGSGDRDDPAVQEVLQRLRNRTQTIATAFEQQAEKAWDQQKFEKLLVEWIAACDQPFDEVEKPEFKELLEYVYSPSRKALHIPGRTTVRRRLMEMGKDTVKDTTDMFAALETKVAISLDAWTSSNQFAFLAIVAHYVSKDGELEELLIDFREVQGAHTGENLADVVWSTLETYGLVGKVIAFVMDNATNNDTLVQSIERRCLERGIPFSADDARMRCTPHIIHLAALKLLEGIGAISSEELDSALHSGAQYQDDVAALLPKDSCDPGEPGEDVYDNEGSGDAASVEETTKKGAKTSKPVTWIDKLRRIIKSVRSSPQRREAWLKEAKLMVDELKEVGVKGPEKALMLILDVRTRWSSTFSMLARALLFRKAITDFTAKDRDLRPYELSKGDWAAIEMVCKWLECFQSATREMSATSVPMLSSTIAIFRGLQEELKNAIRTLPVSTSAEVRTALVNAHKKLSDYYFRFDASPYGTWAALLDPRISYEGLKGALADDDSLLSHLELAKSKLETHYLLYYKSNHIPSVSTAPTASSSSTSFNFTAAFRRAPRAVQNELESYFRMPPEDFETCEPIQWWYAHRLQFPSLYKLAFDILCIPGSAVAVERIFSGGRDLISVRRASLRPNTIRTLMIIKQSVRARRNRAQRQ